MPLWHVDAGDVQSGFTKVPTYLDSAGMPLVWRRGRLVVCLGRGWGRAWRPGCPYGLLMQGTCTPAPQRCRTQGALIVPQGGLEWLLTQLVSLGTEASLGSARMQALVGGVHGLMPDARAAAGELHIWGLI